MPTLDWIGKAAVVNHHRKVPYHLLRCDRELSAGDPDTGNLLVQGDNLLALKALLPHYAGKVKCILRDSLWNPADKAAVESYWQSTRGVGATAKNLDGYAQPVRVPQLAVRDGERCYLFEPEELDEFEWNLDRCDPRVSEREFSVELNIGQRTALDLAERGGMTVGGVEAVIVRQLSIFAEGDDWSKIELASWLDGELHRDEAFKGLRIDESYAWLLRVVDYLLAERRANLPVLVRKRHELAGVVRERIAAHGRGQVRAAANMLINGQSPRRLETSEELAAVLEEQNYCPYHEYHGTLSLPKHAFDKIGAFDNDEENQCAKKIAEHSNVKRWLRNLSCESAGGFSLPLSPKRFYPDFIVELLDCRLGIVEYKGKQRAPLAEELHKKDVGDLWAARSRGTCVFLWVVDRDWVALETGLVGVQR